MRGQTLRRVPLHLLAELLPLDLVDGPVKGAGAEDQQQLLQALLVVRLALAGLRAEHRHLWFTSIQPSVIFVSAFYLCCSSGIGYT